ncbi:MAG TPA: hypothetical protein VFL94_10255 [Actinomycetales bacterium]|nr:hypothetical protein [Actinomycetales bacterium]
MLLADVGYVTEPLLALLVVGVLVLLLRWTFRRGGSLVATSGRRGSEHDYGLLVPVARPATFIEAELLRARLSDHGVRATLAPTTDGPRVLVFAEQERAARAVLKGPQRRT